MTRIQLPYSNTLLCRQAASLARDRTTLTKLSTFHLPFHPPKRETVAVKRHPEQKRFKHVISA